MTIVRIDVSAPSQSVAQGRTLQCTATGTHDDLHTEDLTASCAWNSSVEGVATVGAATGLVTGVSGSDSPYNYTLIRALYGPFSASLALSVPARTLNACLSVDISGATDWVPTALGFVANDVLITNLSGVEIQVSFDGVDPAGIVDAATDSAGHSAVLGFAAGSGGGRGTIWLKRTSGVGGGPLYARVTAAGWPVHL